MKVTLKHKGKHIAVFPRPDSADALKEAREISEWLHQMKIVVFSPVGKKVGSFVKPLTSKALDNLDLAIVFGGDGTYLRATQALAGRPVPILGINMGSLGFLTVTRVNDAYQSIIDTLDKKMEFRPRSILDISFCRRGKVRNKYQALNDAVVERIAGGHIISLGIYFQKKLVCDLKADGIIIASPTGSTAYNLAAGGPIIHPESRVFVITPVNSHSLTMRPIVLPDNHALSIKLLSKQHPAFLTVDGEIHEQISSQDEIIIERNERDHYVVREPSHNYFNILRDKLKFGERA